MGSYLRPTSLQDALAALARRPRVILAGGTDHFPSRVAHTPDEDLLDVGAIAETTRIERRGDGWWLPCGATWSDLIEADLPPLFDGLVAAARQVGGPQIQNAGTVVGNVCNASPAADGVPCLLALDASIALASLSGNRMMRLEDFLLGPRHTARRAEELAIGLQIKGLPDPVRSTFAKLGGRRHLVISIAMLAIVARLASDGAIADIRIALGACGPVAKRLRALEADLIGRRPHPDLVRPQHLDIAPIDDVRGTAAYRRTAAMELLRRGIAALDESVAAAA